LFLPLRLSYSTVLERGLLKWLKGLYCSIALFVVVDSLCRSTVLVKQKTCISAFHGPSFSPHQVQGACFMDKGKDARGSAKISNGTGDLHLFRGPARIVAQGRSEERHKKAVNERVRQI